MTIASKQSNIKVDKISQKQRILNLLKGNAMTSIELQNATNFKAPTIIGRTSELMDEGLIMEREILNGKTVFCKVWAKELEENLKKQREKERVKRILKSIIDNETAFNIVLNVFLESITDELELPEAFKNNLKNKIK